MTSKSFKISAQLKNNIDSLLSGKYGLILFNFYAARFNIPKEVLNQYLKLRISISYNTKNAKFDNILSKSSIFVSIIKYIGYIFSVLFFSKIINKKYQYSLLVDDLQHLGEIDRWLQLEKEFTVEKTVFIAKSHSVKPLNNNNIVYREQLKGYDRKLILKNFPKMLLSDLFRLILVSFKLNINLIHLHLHFINDYFYYQSLFKICSAQYMIQDRNLGRTNALKNHLFKISGGIISSCIQKNILEHNSSALFYDTDIFFSYGNKTSEDIIALGARIDNVVPVGSLSMDNALSKLNLNPIVSKHFDILYIGQNTKSLKTNWKFNYESIVWLVKLQLEKPNLKIAIKHHNSWTGDNEEFEITKGSSIEYIDYSMNSYEVGLQTNLVLTYGSSMGYELISQGVSVAFLDPGKENPFINNFVYSDNIVISSYADLKSMIQNEEINSQNLNVKDVKDYCFTEPGVSKKIYEYLYSYEDSKTNKKLA